MPAWVVASATCAAPLVVARLACVVAIPAWVVAVLAFVFTSACTVFVSVTKVFSAATRLNDLVLNSAGVSAGKGAGGNAVIGMYYSL